MKDIIKYNDFVASVHYSADDDIFYGKILGIDDSITFEGTSTDSLKKAFEEAVEDYIFICRESGKEPLKSYKGSFNVRIDPDLHKKAAMIANELGISLNQLVENAISDLAIHSSPSGTANIPYPLSIKRTKKPGKKSRVKPTLAGASRPKVQSKKTEKTTQKA